MKTKEQIKNEVVSYLTNCSQHIFVKGIEEWNRVNISNGELKDFAKIFLVENGFEIYEFGKIRKMSMEDIDKMVEIYKSNSKNNIKMSIFTYPYSGNKQLRAIRSNRYIKSQIEKILSGDLVDSKEKMVEKKSFLSRILKF